MRARKSGWLLLFGIILLFNGVALAQSNIYTFPGPDVDLGRIDVGTNSSGQHYIGGRRATVYVLRQSGGSVYCHKSTDAGQSFSPGIRVNSTPFGVNPTLKVDTAGVVYVAYQSGDADIYFSKSTDGGQTFIPAIKVNDDTVSQTGQEKPAIAVNNKGQVFITWGDQRNMPPLSTRNLFFAASYDSGRTFTPNIQVNDPALPAIWGIDIAADDSARVYVVWNSFLGPENKGPIYLVRSDDSGLTFPVQTLVTDLPTDTAWARGFFPSLAFLGGIVGVAWEDRRFEQYTLRFASSSNYGQTFSTSVVVDSSGQPQYPSLFWKHGNFYVVWRATHRRTPIGPDLDHIWFSYSRDSGKTFVPFKDAVPDDTNIVYHDWPSVWVSETEKVFVAWADARWDPFFNENLHIFVSVGGPQGIVKGDLNLDGFISVKDVVLELNAVFYGDSFPAPFHRADGNCDWKLTPADMVLLLNRWYWNIPFPCS